MTEKKTSLLDRMKEIAEQNRRLYEEALEDFRRAYLGEVPNQYR